MEQQQQQPTQQSKQQKPCEIERVTYKYGSYDLVIIGDPVRLMDIPLAYYEPKNSRSKSSAN